MSAFVRDVVSSLESCVIHGSSEIQVLGITHDSRKVEPGWMFAAIPGDKCDGHDFIGLAIEKGAAAIVAQTDPESHFRRDSVTWITVQNTRDVLGMLSSVVYNKPTHKISLVGITGTNGKTTLTFLLESIARAAGHTPGVIGTINYRWKNHEMAASNTTPEASDLQFMLNEMVSNGVSHVFMEVSSHGLTMGRLNGCEFDVGVFTNLTQDHLDYHKDMEDYFNAKALLFSRLLKNSRKKNKTAIINYDDLYGKRLLSEIEGIDKLSFGSTPDCDFHPFKALINSDGIDGTISSPRGLLEIESCLTGSFNLSNILAAIAVSSALGFSHDSIVQGIKSLEEVPGRLQRIPSRRGYVFVDYAHTPNALTNVLQALRKSSTGRILTVVGCGGDRDKTKRPLMGEQAAIASDFVLITSDNPRTENPLEIISQIEFGVRRAGLELSLINDHDHAVQTGKYAVIPDRREAIKWIVRQLQENDTLLVAGKGHETYQEIHGVRYPFDDREELLKALELLEP
ncbi:MAG: UDP-N-acetylmuramoyl-L-alanyl-D-glutamate--2,6-diaminopimelate ligase [Syntrophaceae bacterium]|nr:UDP-N-acetylmuramoyl-L-alanyl-D-glutamate--2,6-diaminopimelate ligase [Syntrophaceae bacterium]